MKMNCAFKVALLSVAIATATGCASNTPPPQKTNIYKSDAIKELYKVSVEARDELRLLAKIQDAKSEKILTKEQHEQKFLKATTIPKGFDKIGTFKYTGKAHKAARALALATGYRFSMDNKPPVHEPWVHIEITDQPLVDALNELGTQTGELVNIGVHSGIIRVDFNRN